jgi:uncharacterized protein (UPF0332 family)
MLPRPSYPRSFGKAVKTHKGVQTELHRLTKADPTFSVGLRSFLSQAYNLKAIADYETGPGSEVSAERAATTLEAGDRFVVSFEKVLAALPESNGNPPHGPTPSRP